MRLKGKTALIAGGASGVEGRLMGIGGAAVRRFAREGAQVVIADIKDEIGEETASEIRAEGGEALYVHLDVTGRGGVDGRNWCSSRPIRQAGRAGRRGGDIHPP